MGYRSSGCCGVGLFFFLGIETLERVRDQERRRSETRRRERRLQILEIEKMVFCLISNKFNFSKMFLFLQ